MHLLRVGIALPGDISSLNLLAPDAIRWMGLTPEESVYPEASTEHPGCRLLLEYFACPEKFLFFEVNDIRPEIFGVAVSDLTVSIDLRSVVAARFLPLVDPGPHAIFIKPVFNGLIGVFVKLPELPLTRDGSCVAGIAEIMSKGSNLGTQKSKLCQVTQKIF